MTWMIMNMTSSVFLLRCWIVAHISAIKLNSSCWVHICCQYYLLSKYEKHFRQKLCSVSQETAGGSRWYSIPVTRSLSGPITAWSPSAVNSMFPLWELMRRFRACPWACFGPATTKTTTAKIPEAVWQYYTEIKQIKSFSSCYIFQICCA